MSAASHDTVVRDRDRARPRSAVGRPGVWRVEPAGSAAFDLLDCGDIVEESFCAVTNGVDLTIAAR